MKFASFVFLLALPAIVWSQQLVPKKDPVLTILEQTSEENQKKITPPEYLDLFGLSAELGFPHPLNLAAQYFHSSRQFSLELAVGSTALKIDGTDTQVENQEMTFRWHPNARAFYFGLGFGNQKLKVKDSDTVSSQEVTVQVDIKSQYVKPVIGWLWGAQNGGFFYGFELGWQFPSNNKTKITTSQDFTGNPDYDQLIDDINEVADLIGKSSVPNIGLIKLGWFF
jgi:hypothetical protein